MWHGTDEGFCWRNRKKGYHFEDLGVDDRIGFKWILKKEDERA
jgi:hypothetical protein